MDTVQMLGYEKLETLYENRKIFICRVRNKTGKTVLLKAMKDDHPSVELQARFGFEYTLLSRVDLPGIIRVIELAKDYQSYVIVMEDAGGIPLLDAPIFKILRHGDRQLTLSKLQQILEIFIEMAQVIGRLHDIGLIHKDIKPANFLLMPDFGRVEILDFSLASYRDNPGDECSTPQKAEGNLSYLSPEQTGRVDKTVDYRTDFYALGITLYELITGQKPFDTEDSLEMIHCHIALVPEPPHAVNPAIPEMVSAIIMKLIEKAPEQRYQSAAGIVHDLGKCLEGLHASVAVEFFDIGKEDESLKFQIPQKLYGRDAEREMLEQVYSQVMDGDVRFLLIGGQAGAGKTTFVQNVCHPTPEDAGYFAGGKAEQFQQNTPYFVFVQAVRELVGTLLQQPDSLLEQCRERILFALNGNGRLITDLVPELAAVIGEQPQLNELGPAESRNRFFNTFANFFRVFTRKNHPLTLFLDDLQWCDLPSMEVIKYLMSRDDMKNLLLISCYRDNELTEGHSLYPLLDELQKSKKTVALTVRPLKVEDVETMLADTLHCIADQVRVLAGIVHKKTEGNPFFVRKLLLHLYDVHAIRYNEEIRKWEWDEEAIERTGARKDLVDFVIDQIKKLPLETQNLLIAAALAGSSFDLKLLSQIEKISVVEAAARLQEAVASEIILPDDDAYRFVHDRVQQACIELIDPGHQKKLHLQIGRIKRQNTPSAELPDQAMDIVSHINVGLEWVDDTEERWELVRLNLWACQKAKASSAFHPAFQYATGGVRALPENAWTQDYGATYEMIKTYVECAYLDSNYALAEEQVRILLAHAKTNMEQAEIRLMQSTLCNFQSQLDKAIEYAFQGLKLLRIHIPAVPGMPLLIKEMVVVKVGLLGKSQEDLLNMPQVQNEKIKKALRLLNEINKAAYLFGNTNLFLLSILKRMQLTLKYGNYHEAGTAYVAYALILAMLGDLLGTYKFCELALMSHKKEQSYECRPTTLFSSGFFGHAWNRSWRDVHQWFERAMKEAVKYGDHHTIALAGSFMYAFKPDAGIRALAEKAMKQYSLVKQTNNRLSINLTFLMIHRWLNYAGLTDGQFTMSVSRETHVKNSGMGIVFSEEECLDELQKGNFLSALGVYYKEKMYICYLYEDYAGALRFLKESDKYLQYHIGTPYIVECRICSFLVLTANLPDLAQKEAGIARRRMRKELSYMKTWAKHCPVNFEHLQYIMEAELARLAGKTHEAADLYDRAVQTARQNGFIRDEALSNELAAKMFIELGKERQAKLYMTEALNIYRLWGANAKVDHMTEKYGQLVRAGEYRSAESETAADSENLDLLSIVAAARAISEEAQLPNLLRQILKTVIENSGAQKACILLKSERGWSIEAETLTGTEDVKVLQSILLEEADGLLPSSVINFCIRTGEYLVVRDAAKEGHFTKDPYIQQNQTRSLLCMPILNQGSQEGILYLENNLSADVFTKERVHTLQLLAAQFSISIKNIRLFTDLLAKTEEVHQASEEVLRSDIAFLQAQIKPHFLYNAINTISAFSLDDSQTTRDLLASLSQYLRGSFDFKNRDKLVTLRKELELVEAYLSIEKARFGERLQVIYHVDDSVDCLLPPLIIQPLVENAVQHGLSGRKKGGTVEITVRDEKDSVAIIVEDDGVGIEEDVLENLLTDQKEGNGGVALKNIHRRLLQLYGHGLVIESKVAGGTRVSIRIKK